MSPSASYSSNSPPEPTTPPLTPRLRSRYSDLGRVPLHRRGNSKTYERLEDLLKEAGYKETRVFTPETERSRSDGDGSGGAGENRLSVRDGMEAVVGFFAGLLPGAMTSKTSLVPPPESDNSGPAQFTISPQDYLPSPSPLTTRALQRQGIGGGGYDLADPPTPPTMTSSMESLGEPTSRLIRHHSANTVSLHAPQTNHSQRPPLPHRNSSQFSRQQSSRRSLHHQAIQQQQQQQQQHSNIASPRPSRPSVYMRHMSSPSIQPRPNSTPAHMSKPAIFVSDNDSSSRRVERDTHDANLPPLPPSWLETVTRAVLFGGTGAHIGGPSSFISHGSFTGRSSSPLFAKTHVLRSARSSLSQVSARKSKYHRPTMNRRNGLSDQTNSPISPSGSRSTFLGPPSLFHQIERGRSRRSEGEVSRTRVLCRSAPGSRSGSVTRDDGGKERRKKSRKKEEKARLPSLARTQAEGDVWDRERNEVRTRGGSNNPNRYLSGCGADAHSEAGSSSEEEEEEEELDLARILVPPKRQNSIRSLRMHLAPEASLGPSAHSSLKSYAARAGPSGRRRSGRELYVSIGGSNNRDRNARHRGIPGRRPAEDWDGESQEEWGCGWVRRGARSRGTEDEDVDPFVGIFGEGRTSLTAGTSSKTGFW